jgi:glycosyltransferase involved in cell wall biosynthesis
MKLITFVVPCYNSAGFMSKCIDSLLTVSDRDMEIIIINDGSKDNTGEIADKYMEKHPGTIRVRHQENGGHGEGINQGLRLAEGIYFKVVDSDDWVDEAAVAKLMDFLEAAREKDEFPDLIVCNYVYEQMSGEPPKTIKYTNALDAGRMLTWDDTRRFRLSQYLTLHSVVYKTDVVRQSGLNLPKKISYEDNYFVYKPLPHVKTLYYLDIDLYRYQIGREGQSVSHEVLKKQAAHQAIVSEMIFTSHDLREIKAKNKKLWKYMSHEASFMIMLACVFLRLNESEEAEAQRRELWRKVKKTKGCFKLKYFSIATVANLPGRFGIGVARTGYRLAHKVVNFN